jgi:hypothetical protein
MTLLDTTPPKPPRRVGRYVLLFLLLIILCGTICLLCRDLPEERAVTHFLTTLEHGDFQEAYKLWQPSQFYTYQNFLHDWGDEGDYGRIQGFNILGTSSRGSQTVMVTVTINDEQPALKLLVDRRTKGISYSFY